MEVHSSPAIFATILEKAKKGENGRAHEKDEALTFLKVIAAALIG